MESVGIAMVSVAVASDGVSPAKKAAHEPLTDLVLRRVGSEVDVERLERELPAVAGTFTPAGTEGTSAPAYHVFKLLFAASRGSLKEVQSVASRGAAVRGADYDSRTALHLASAEGYLDVVAFLVEAGADVNARDRFGNSPVDDAARHGRAKVTAYLLEHGAIKPSASFEAELIAAASSGDVVACQRLLDNKVNPDARDYDGRSALHLAAAAQSEACVRLLLRFGADAKAIDRWAGTPLTDALRSGPRVGNNSVAFLLKGAVASAAHAHSGLWGSPFALLFFPLQLVVLIMYALFAKYDPKALHLERYPMFQDVNVMVFVGFGFLMTFIRKGGYTAIAVNMLIAAWSLQLFPLLSQFWHNVLDANWSHAVSLNVGTLIMADFGAAAALISFGALLGKTNAEQMFVIVVLETVFYTLNENIGIHMGVSDLGGSMTIHAFGAFFGLALSAVLTPPTARGPSNNAAVYHSDLFSMIGTLFLWMYWPSFNAAFADGELQSQAVINTLLSLSASCLATFACSQWMRGKFALVDIQNATLAGGVAMGTCANLDIVPAVAIAIGVSAGCASTVGYVKLLPFLEARYGLHDTCGVLNLHGIPSIMGGIYGAIAAVYTGGRGITGGIQMAYLVITITIATSSGLLVGRLVDYVMPRPAVFFDDSESFEVPEMEVPYYFDKRGENKHSGGAHAE